MLDRRALPTSPLQSVPLVRIEGLNKWFGAVHVLKNIDLTLRAGARVVVCGPSGSGKSTLVRCINGLERFQKGTIEFEGRSLGKTDAETARRLTGMVFQSFNLFPHLTVLANCTLALRRVLLKSAHEAEEIAMRHLMAVHIPEKARAYPAELSGGQQQRAAIARALCLDPRIMLFDEPTSALDPEMIKEVLDVMIALAGSGVTMVCVTHEMGFAREVADEVVFMDEGRIVEHASSSDFFSVAAHPRARRFLDTILSH
ncbi:amino acid ABC transporter ATP-binding protein [Mesorhizobium sp. B2-5-9]|uniref:amino acid ABC transporter ATP-binding protein n=1 Tax=unclassified Mesorhizobium TaxID=325217 RepID=UPI00112C7995|nr:MULTISPECIES: amino acid ABC transporter ATP-binding protein [unclassified Mesorhizobium]TPK20083.1 amino acid ABC transporter ATP-binding protein [Mesorhizobium sp. B2-5-9]TPK80989.1 amino acid ABC transporter ATP-binding protein [Mesorhizobium sp. B2-4-13]